MVQISKATSSVDNKEDAAQELDDLSTELAECAELVLDASADKEDLKQKLQDVRNRLVKVLEYVTGEEEAE